MVEFPVRYTFNVVGKTDGDEAISAKYVEDVKNVIMTTSGETDVKWEITPRGKKFTKIKCETEVQSSTMVNKIYQDISKLELTVMNF